MIIIKKAIYKNVVIRKDYIDDRNYSEFEESKYIEELNARDLISNEDEVKEFAQNCKEIFEQIQSKRGAKYADSHLRFVYDTALLVAGKHNDNKIKVIPARAGFGKSTTIYSILSSVIKQIDEGCWNEGVIIVTDKLKDLKELNQNLLDEFGYYYEKDKEKITYSYLIQAWNSDVCINPFVSKKSYNEAVNECNYECPYYQICEINTQYYKQRKSPILLMSNMKFAKYRSQIEKFQTYIDIEGNEQKRTIVLIDEKPAIVDPIKIDDYFITSLISTANNIQIDKDDKEQCNKKLFIMQELINLQQRLLDIQKNYMEKLSVYPVTGNPKGVLFSEEFFNYWEEFLKNKEIDKFDALERLLISEGGLLHRTNKITYFNVLNRNDFMIEGMKTLIFDATAAIDPDYNDTDSFIYMYVDDYRDFSNVTIFNYKDINLSRSAFKSNKGNWKNKALAKWFDKKFSNGFGGVFVVTYLKQASIFTKLIKSKRVKYLELENKEKQVAHFGSTKGKNHWKNCYVMVQLGWNNKDSNDYLARAYSRSIKDLKEAWDYLRKEPSRADDLANKFINEGGKFINSLIAEVYRHCHMAAEFEQEIFRTAMRKHGDNTEVNIYVFKMHNTVRELIWYRLNKTPAIVDICGEFEDWANEKSKAYNDGKSTHKSRFIDWHNKWDGNEVSINEIKSLLNLNDNQWKDLRRKKEVRDIINSLKRTKHGNDYFYSKIA